MKKISATIGLLSLLFPLSVNAGGLSSSFGVSAKRMTGNNWGNTTGNVISAITQDNEMQVETYSKNYQVDISAENARIGFRERGDSTSTSELGVLPNNSWNQGTIHDQASNHDPNQDSVSIETSSSIPTTESIPESSISSIEEEIHSTTQGIASRANQLSSSGHLNSWEGLQSEGYIDGTLSASEGSGWTSTTGTIREAGTTTTDLKIDTFNDEKSFGNTATSFSSTSF